MGSSSCGSSSCGSSSGSGIHVDNLCACVLAMSYAMAAASTMQEEDTLLRSEAQGRLGKALAVGVAGLLAVVGTSAATTIATLRLARPAHGDVRAVEGLDEMLVVKPAYESCAKAREDCLEPRCCAGSGYSCFKTSSGKGQCMKECTPGGLNGTCEGVAPHMKKVVASPGGSLFCFSCYTANTGSENAWNIFSCAEWAVYSDVSAPLGGGDMTIRVEDVKGDFHFAKRKEAKTWINTGMFVQIWTALRDAGHATNHDWVVKADADAVFFPWKLVDMLRDANVPAEGLYMENCKYVDWGYFGNLEVFSKQAFSTLVQNLDTCYTQLPWKVGVHGGKHGPMGEDLFAQKCMDLLGVAKQENFGLTTDGACEADRPVGQEKNKKYVPNCEGVSTPSIHPFKKPEEYAACWAQAASVQP